MLSEWIKSMYLFLCIQQESIEELEELEQHTAAADLVRTYLLHLFD